jgi:hypothetical protein
MLLGLLGVAALALSAQPAESATYTLSLIHI